MKGFKRRITCSHRKTGARLMDEICERWK